MASTKKVRIRENRNILPQRALKVGSEVEVLHFFLIVEYFDGMFLG